jgi:phosphocarrier protein HPr
MSKGVVGTAKVVNLLGVHARPASALVRLANQFEAAVEIAKGDVRVNCKSIMGVLMLAAEQGSALEFSARGTDAEKAVAALVALVESGFPGLDGD